MRGTHFTLYFSEQARLQHVLAFVLALKICYFFTGRCILGLLFSSSI